MYLGNARKRRRREREEGVDERIQGMGCSMRVEEKRKEKGEEE